ncbi:hypothetical protein Tco_0655928 [Tanacetum coccineum]|uniref:Uncharacterized protein n=1 Tax=Tanacetum coccineum TaxID=301880 RepID=A0ABQ4X7C2_9ASTR
MIERIFGTDNMSSRERKELNLVGFTVSHLKHDAWVFQNDPSSFIVFVGNGFMSPLPEHMIVFSICWAMVILVLHRAVSLCKLGDNVIACLAVLLIGLGGLKLSESDHDPRRVYPRYQLPLSAITRSHSLQLRENPAIRILEALLKVSGIWVINNGMDSRSTSLSRGSRSLTVETQGQMVHLSRPNSGYCGHASFQRNSHDKQRPVMAVGMHWEHCGYLFLGRVHSLQPGSKLILVQVIRLPERLASRVFLEWSVPWRLPAPGSCQARCWKVIETFLEYTLHTTE